jgi:hypothetical protein
MSYIRDFKWFVLPECFIYIAFTILDIGYEDPSLMRVSVALKLLSIAICVVFLSRLTFVNPENRDARFMVLVMGLTLSSDVILLLTRQFTVGLVLFVIVQGLYSIRIQKRLNMKGVFVSGAVFIACLLFFMQKMPERFNYALMLALGVFYALLFTWNIVSIMIKRSNDDYDRRLFAVGLILYALCDINVAIYNFPSFFDSNVFLSRIYASSGLAMWLFYLPGQVALTLSVRRKVDGVNG